MKKALLALALLTSMAASADPAKVGETKSDCPTVSISFLGKSYMVTQQQSNDCAKDPKTEAACLAAATKVDSAK